MSANRKEARCIISLLMKEIMLRLQGVSYAHPNKELLFCDVSLVVNEQEKIALIGNNGTGKSTLLRIIANELQPSTGQLIRDADVYYVPQNFGQFDHLTIAQALRIEEKISALQEVINGNTTERNFDLLNDDWTIEERCKEALAYWQLNDLELTQPLETLSGGQKTKVFLAGLAIHQPALVLLDEPSNHLDGTGRNILYAFVQSTKSSLVVVSHDRKLLGLLDTVCELGKNGVKVYGGNYQFYVEQKQVEGNALSDDIQSKEKALRKAKEKERETVERQQKLDSRGKAKQEKAGVARIMMNTLRNSAEKSTAKATTVHAEKIDGLSQELQALRSSLPGLDKMKFGFDNSSLHIGKVLVTALGINFSYGAQRLWKGELSFQIRSGERIALQGGNGSGKTTLIKLILGELEPKTGTVDRANIKSVYVDQDYSLLLNHFSVYEQAQRFNTAALLEHEIKTRLHQFLFTKDDWDKPCSVLSGGERMRLMLCCLTIGHHSPDFIVLDEPTNNLDIQNVEILRAAVNEYHGTIIVISHDEMFLEQIGIDRTIRL